MVVSEDTFPVASSYGSSPKSVSCESVQYVKRRKGWFGYQVPECVQAFKRPFMVLEHTVVS